MGRRRRGRDIHGWLVVDKPAGLTSTAVVNKVRWAFDAKKAGHAGTLDPDATGVLAVALGEATKTVPFITDAMKAYVFTVTFGAATNTDDAEGEVVQTSGLRPTDDQIIEALKGTGNSILLGMDGSATALTVDMIEKNILEAVELLGGNIGRFSHNAPLRKFGAGGFSQRAFISIKPN